MTQFTTHPPQRCAVVCFRPKSTLESLGGLAPEKPYDPKFELVAADGLPGERGQAGDVFFWCGEAR